MKINYTIKSRWNSNKILFETEIDVPEDATEGQKLGACCRLAVATRVILADADLAGADLADADLAGADLADADLAGTNFARADLAGADLAGTNLARVILAGTNLTGTNLAGTNLAGTNLAGANLTGANLAGANFARANLAGTNLAGAKILDDATLVGERPLLQIGPIGSRADTLCLWLTNRGPLVQTGCFGPDTIDEFSKAVADEHADTVHGKEYFAAITVMQTHARLWAPEE